MMRSEVELVRNERVGPDGSLLTFRGPLPEKAPLPGQFYMVKLMDPGFPLFGRALAVLDAEGTGATGEVSFLLKAVGRGTGRLREAPVGSSAMLVGPAGTVFPKLDADRPSVFVAGGTGLAGFHYLLKRFRDRLSGTEPLLLYGARDAASLYLADRLERLPVGVRFSTEDGSAGRRGLVTTLLEEALKDMENPLIFACGPDGMMKAVSRIGRDRGAETILSLETRMACGIGVCNGCAVSVLRDGKAGFERVCHEGPVFDARLLPEFWTEFRERSCPDGAR